MCGSTVSSTVFTASGSTLVYGGSDAFSADEVASGSTQVTVYAGSGHESGLMIQWGGE